MFRLHTSKLKGAVLSLSIASIMSVAGSTAFAGTIAGNYNNYSYNSDISISNSYIGGDLFILLPTGFVPYGGNNSSFNSQISIDSSYIGGNLNIGSPLDYAASYDFRGSAPVIF